MTIGIHLKKIALSLALLLTVIRGRLLFFVARFKSVEFYVRTATGFTRSNSRDITRPHPSRSVSEELPKSMASKPKMVNPSDRINDIQRGRVACDDVSLSEWVELVTMAMVSQDLPHLNIDINHKGGIYSFHHCIKQIKPPADTGAVLENVH